MKTSLEPVAKFLAVVMLSVVAAQVLFAVVTFPRLPARYPIHFDAAGEVDGYAPGDSPAWFLLPGVSLLVVLITLASVRGGQSLPPWWLNVPHKKRFLGLPEEARRPVMRAIGTMMMSLGVPSSLLFASLQWMLYRVAMHPGARFRPGVVFVGVALMGIITIIGTRNVRSIVEEQLQRHGA